jgi:AcrR family transcriptional regulator
VAAALPLLARQGPLSLSLDDVAARAGVTRNLLYHYFPDGKADLVTAVVQETERQLLGDTGRPRTAAEGWEEEVSRIFDHALAPTHAWRVHRMARASGLSGPAGAVDHSTRQVVRRLSEAGPLHGGLTPVAELALQGYVSFAEAVLDGARAVRLPRAQIRKLLGDTLQALLGAG